MSIHFKRFQQ